MGVGGVMRAASKVTGIGAISGGVRGVPGISPSDQMVGNISRPVSAILSSSSLTNAKAAVGSEVETVQRPLWEIGDWEFAGVEDELVIETRKPLPRVVFEAVTSLDEAKEATVGLKKEALDRVYLSASKTSESSGSIVSNSELDNESSIVGAGTNASVPKYALQAFKLLSESHQAQSVFLSVASDPNVWEAVLGNSAVQDLSRSQNTVSVPETVFQPHNQILVEDASQTEKSGNRIHKFLSDVKLSVVNLATNVTSSLQNIFGFSEAKKKSAVDKGENSSIFTEKQALGGSVIGLVVTVAMVVLLKRA